MVVRPPPVITISRAMRREDRLGEKYIQAQQTGLEFVEGSTRKCT
jgi:hypothetical protein